MITAIILFLLVFTIGFVHLVWPFTVMRITSYFPRFFLTQLLGPDNISPPTREKWRFIDEHPEEFRQRVWWGLLVYRIFGFFFVMSALLILFLEIVP
jgi:hypothetical protein